MLEGTPDLVRGGPGILIILLLPVVTGSSYVTGFVNNAATEFLVNAAPSMTVEVRLDPGRSAAQAAIHVLSIDGDYLGGLGGFVTDGAWRVRATHGGISFDHELDSNNLPGTIIWGADDVCRETCRVLIWAAGVQARGDYRLSAPGASIVKRDATPSLLFVRAEDMSPDAEITLSAAGAYGGVVRDATFEFDTAGEFLGSSWPFSDIGVGEERLVLNGPGGGVICPCFSFERETRLQPGDYVLERSSEGAWRDGEPILLVGVDLGPS